MSDGLRWKGHPIHPMLVHFPLGLLLLIPMWDLLARAGVGTASEIARWTQGAGLVLGLVATVPGAIDWFALRGDPVRTRLGDRHLLAATAALSITAVAVVVRAQFPLVRDVYLLLDVTAALALAATGRTGGELVYGHGVGVDRRTVEEAVDPEAVEADRERAAS